MDPLSQLRKEIDEIDNTIVDLLAKRMAVTKKVKKIKYDNHIMYFDRDRYLEILKKRAERGGKWGLAPEFVREIFNIVHKESLDEILSE